MEVCGGVQKGVQGGVQAMKGQVGKKAGLHGCLELGNWENWCGGHIESTPTIGSFVPLVLVCGENSSRRREPWLDGHVQMWQCSQPRRLSTGGGAGSNVAEG